MMKLILDTGVLGFIVHPASTPRFGTGCEGLLLGTRS